jgi:hypothetical protein
MDTDQGTSTEQVLILPWVDQGEDCHHMKNRHFWTLWSIFWPLSWRSQNRKILPATQRWCFCCSIPWYRNISQRISVRLRLWLLLDVPWRCNGTILTDESIKWMWFESLFFWCDISRKYYRSISKDVWHRKYWWEEEGRQDFFTPPIWPITLYHKPWPGISGNKLMSSHRRLGNDASQQSQIKV